MFFPPEKNILLYNMWRKYEISIPEKSYLQIWHVKNETFNDKAIIYFGGNAEDVSSALTMTSKFEASDLFYVNLSGYGESSGTPSEKTFFADGAAVYRFVISYCNSSESCIILMGRSIGSATAIYLASKYNPAKLIVVTPFESVSAMIPAIIKLFIPFDFMIKNKFNNAKCIQYVKCPVLVIAADNDEIVPLTQVKKVSLAVKPAASFTVIEKTNHQTIFLSDDSFIEINNFLGSSI